MKYVIEIEDKKLCEYDKDTHTYFPRLWKAKGFNALVFDKNGLEKLTPLDKELEEAYQKGLDDAWEAARKIIRIWRATPSDELYAIFGLTMSGPIFSALHDLFNAQTAEEAIEKLRAYEEQQKAAEDEITVGDEIIYTCCDGMVRFVVWEISDDRYEGTRTTKSDSLGRWTWVKKKAKGIKKTGRHFDVVEQLLDL